MLNEILGNSAFRIFPITKDGVSSNVFKIDRDIKPNLYLKIAHLRETDFTIEDKISKILLEKGVKLPKVEFSCKSHPLFNRSIIITNEIEGEPLTDHTLRTVSKEVAQQLNIINSIKIKGFGLIKSIKENEITATFPTYYEYFNTNIQFYFKELSEFYPEIDRIKESFYTHLSNEIEKSKSISEGRLIHGDMGNSHIRHQNGKLSGIIDFDDIKSSTPFYDILELSNYKEHMYEAIIHTYHELSKRNMSHFTSIFALEKLYCKVEELYFLSTTYKLFQDNSIKKNMDIFYQYLIKALDLV